MRIFDKILNKALQFKSIDVSVDEMADLIETRLIANCSAQELAKLKRGLKKRWVLAVGRGSSVRYYPSASSSVYVAMDFNILLHTLSQITLCDTTTKEEFFIPKGKHNLCLLQEKILSKL